MPYYQTELLAANDHNDLEQELNAWLSMRRPLRVIDINFVADGAEFTYCVLILYLPREKPLPR